MICKHEYMNIAFPQLSITIATDYYSRRFHTNSLINLYMCKPSYIKFNVYGFLNYF